jgi:hypothetical protein
MGVNKGEMQERTAMTTLPNDDFDMCCGSRPHVRKFDPLVTSPYFCNCGICGDKQESNELVTLMIEWNKWQRSKV